MEKRIHTVGVVAIENEFALLVKHGEKADHLTGVWGLPGGRLDGDESLLDAAEREFEEETGLTPLKASIIKIPTIFKGDIKRKSGEILKTFWNVFLVKEFNGELISTDETVPQWIEIEELSEFPNLLPNTENAIRESLNLLNQQA